MKLIDQLKKHEGLRLKPYLCSAGKLTIGYGLNLDAGITDSEASYLLEKRVHNLTIRLQYLSFWMGLSGVRRAVLIDMAYNLGVDGLFKFKKMLSAINAKDFDLAAEEMECSKWFGQVGQRAITLQKMMVTDEWSN